MAQPQKIVKGGFRATLALIIAVIALIVSILAYTSSKEEQGMKARISSLQATMEKMKTESVEQLDKLRKETAKALENMSNALKKEAGSGEGTKGSTAGAKN